MVTSNHHRRSSLSTYLTLAVLICSATVASAAVSKRLHITSLYPTGGPISGGTRVTVRGPEIFDNPLYPTPQCRFGVSKPTPGTYVKCTSHATYKERSSVEDKDRTCIQCEYSPESPIADVVPLSVSMTGDFLDSGNSAPFHYYDVPTISRVLPRHGLGSGKTNVTVTGEGFFDTQEDLLCGFGARIVKAEFISPQEVRCVSPSAEVTQNHGIPFGVTLNDQQFTNPSVTYYYYDDPYVSTPVPYRIPTTGGIPIELWGQFFDPYDEFVGIPRKGTAYVNVGGFKLDLEILSDTRARFTAPPSEKTIQVPVLITLNDQQYTNTVYIEYYRPPNVSTLSPRLGPVRGGTIISVIGSGFDPTKPVQCKFGDKVIEGKMISVNEIQCESPQVANPGYVDLSISQKDDEWSAGDTTFLYYESPVIDSITPTCGPTTGYTQIGVWGKNFLELKPGMLKCVFGDFYMDAVLFNSTYLECDSPPVLDNNQVVIDDKWSYFVEISLDGPDDKYGEQKDTLRFDYYTQPKVKSLSPSLGFTVGGTAMRIKRDADHGAFDQEGVCKVVVRFATIETEEIPLAQEGQDPDNYKEEGALSTWKTYGGQKFSYLEIEPYYTEDYIVLNVPEINIGEKCYQILPEEVVVNVALNGQQFTDERMGVDWNAAFSFMKPPVFFSSSPGSGPASGNTLVHISGREILPPVTRKQRFKGIDDEFNNEDTVEQRRLDNAMKTLKVRLVDDDGTVYGEGELDSVSDSKVDFRTPAGEAQKTAKILYSPNDGQDWLDSGMEFKFLNAPQVESIDPSFAALSDDDDLKIQVYGKNFECIDGDCSNIRCRYGKGEQAITVEGTHKTDNHIECPAPKTKRPDVYPLEISINKGNDFTDDGLEFAYYDAFVLSLDPKIGPAAGGTEITVTGFGFADTGDNLMCRFGAKDELDCPTKGCIVKATYIDKEHIKCQTWPMEELQYDGGRTVRDTDEIDVEVAVYEKAFTNNQIKFSYYPEETFEFKQQNEDGELADVDEESAAPPKYLVSPLSNTSDMTDPETIEQMKKMKARFINPDNPDEYIDVPASFIHVPVDEEGEPNAIGFAVPKWPSQGDVDVKVSLNGHDYQDTGMKLNFPQPLEVHGLSPRAGPVSGGTVVAIDGNGFTNPEELHVNWGTQSSPVVTSITDPDLFSEQTPTRVFARTCVTQQNFTDGGHVLVEIGRHHKTKGIKGGSALTTQEDSTETAGDADESTTESTEQQKRRLLAEEPDKFSVWASDTVSIEEFYYYKDPAVMNIFPKAGPAGGLTTIHVEGHWFRDKPDFGATPWCLIGEDTKVRGRFISTVRVECDTPSSEEALTVPIKVSLNEVDWTTNEINFDYYFSPIIKKLVPNAGPKTGGTDIKIIGENFKDLAANKEFYCRFESVEDDMEPHYVLPRFKSPTEIHCVAPGGWDTGTVASVEVTFNNRDYTNYGLTFGFFQIDEVFPKAGPHRPAEDDYIEIRGSGFTENDEAACFFGAKEYAPLEFTSHLVKCPLPGSERSDSWWENNSEEKIELKITLNGRDYMTIPEGFTYYKQPKVYSIGPSIGPASGNSLVKVYGSGFSDDFDNASPACLIGDVVGKVKVVSSHEIHCTTGRFDVTPFDNTAPVQIALNGHSWTDPNGSATDYSVYDVFHVTPNSGPLDGQTEIMVYGVGFSNNPDEARCRFGVSDNYQIVQATVLDDQRLVCSSRPGFQVPAKANLPFAVPFSVALSDDQFDPWTNNHVKFRIYSQPRVGAVFPREGPVDETTEVLVMSQPGSEFHKPVPIMTAGGDFNESYGLQCRFGNFGEVDAIYVNSTAVKCFTPSTGLDKRKVYRIDSIVAIAQNGQDYTTDDVRYTFTGKASGAFVWLKLIAFLLLILLIGAGIFYCCQNIPIQNLISAGGSTSESTSVNRANQPRTFRDGDQVVRPKTGNVAAGDNQKTWQPGQQRDTLGVQSGGGARMSQSPFMSRSPYPQGQNNWIEPAKLRVRS